MIAALLTAIRLVALSPPASIEARLLHHLDEEVQYGRSGDAIRIPGEIRILRSWETIPDFIPKLDSARASLERRKLWEKR